MAFNAHQGTHVPSVRDEMEKKLGILERCAPFDFGWTGDIRKRFTDFQVNEILKDGSVVHLSDFSLPESPASADRAKKASTTEPAPPSAEPAATKPSSSGAEDQVQVDQVSDSDQKLLEAVVGAEAVKDLIELDRLIQTKKLAGASATSVKLPEISDRQKRGTIHQEIRRIFASRLDTTTDKTGVIIAAPAPGKNSPSRQRKPWPRPGGYGQPLQSFGALGGDYLHFTLYKENRDTVDAVGFMARLLKAKPKSFGFSGTKDRRAATAQRVSVYRQRAHTMIRLNSSLMGAKIGEFKHCKSPLQLGQHAGNEFVITLKNCHHYMGGNSSVEAHIGMIRLAVEMGLSYLNAHGFLNYFGLQRFGTHTVGTHEVGIKILREDYEGAIEAILHVDPQYMTGARSDNHAATYDSSASRDEVNRARGIATWKDTGSAKTALGLLPRRFGAEASIISHLGPEAQRKDYMGALLSITRGIRLMYIHAYQSYVWNHVVTQRWAKYGSRVIEGDLIILESEIPDPTEFDDDGTRGASADWDHFYTQVRPLTSQDVASGKYSIFDIVLPTPGYDVIYPVNDIGEYYKTFMGCEENGGLDPYNMRRRHREFSLSGSYRHIVARLIQKPEYFVRAYSHDSEQMHPTDMDIILQKKGPAAQSERKRKIQEDKPVTRSAVGTTPRETTATGNRWANFADNVRQDDLAVAQEIARQHAEAPAVPGGGDCGEKWIQTGIDDSGKRLKISRHDVAGNETPKWQEASSSAVGTDLQPSEQDTVMTTGSDPAEPRTVDENIPTTGTTGQDPAITAPTTDETGDTKSKPHLENGSATSGDAVAVPGIADLVTDSPGHDDNKVATNSGAETHGSCDIPSADGSDTVKDTQAAHDPTPAPLTAQPAPVVADPSAPVQGPRAPAVGTSAARPEPALAPIAIPKFQQLSDNPILAFAPAPSTHPKPDYGGGKKIAVVLKFQLPSSCYATVFLRELMGVYRQGNNNTSNRSSRESTPGVRFGGNNH